MRLHLKTKITLTIALLVLAVVGASSWLYLAALTRQVIRQADERAQLVTQQVFSQAQHALADAAAQGHKPASNDPADLLTYVRGALDEDAALTSLIDSEVGYSILVYEVTIVDRDGTALISSDSSLPGRKAQARPPLSQLLNSGFIQQLRAIYGPPQAYEIAYPFKLGPPDARFLSAKFASQGRRACSVRRSIPHCFPRAGWHWPRYCSRCCSPRWSAT